MTPAGANETRSLLAADARAGRFVLTTSLGTLPAPDPDALRAKLRALAPAFSVVHFTDNPRARARVSPWAAAAFALGEGFEPVVHVGCRDRNRLALKADLLGGQLLGIRNVLCLHGDEIEGTDEPAARAVRDTDVIELIGLASGVGGYLVLAGCDPNAGESESHFARLRQKVEAGAGLLEAQPVFDAQAFARWLGRARDAGISTPVLVDVFCLATAEQAAFLANIPFVRAPEGLEGRLRRDPGAGVKLAAEVVAGLREVPGVAGCHLLPLVGDPALALAVRELLGA